MTPLRWCSLGFLLLLGATYVSGYWWAFKDAERFVISDQEYSYWELVYSPEAQAISDDFVAMELSDEGPSKEETRTAVENDFLELASERLSIGREELLDVAHRAHNNFIDYFIWEMGHREKPEAVKPVPIHFGADDHNDWCQKHSILHTLYFK